MSSRINSGISRQALSDMMLNFLRSAGNMSGKTNDAAACIKTQFPLALYIHCASHSLNLTVVSSPDEVNVRNMIGVVNRVLIFSLHILSVRRSLKMKKHSRN